jgi:hypothetical protein
MKMKIKIEYEVKNDDFFNFLKKSSKICRVEAISMPSVEAISMPSVEAISMPSVEAISMPRKYKARKRNGIKQIDAKSWLKLRNVWYNRCIRKNVKNPNKPIVLDKNDRLFLDKYGFIGIDEFYKFMNAHKDKKNKYKFLLDRKTSKKIDEKEEKLEFLATIDYQNKGYIYCKDAKTKQTLASLNIRKGQLKGDTRYYKNILNYMKMNKEKIEDDILTLEDKSKIDLKN